MSDRWPHRRTTRQPRRWRRMDPANGFGERIDRLKKQTFRLVLTRCTRGKRRKPMGKKWASFGLQGFGAREAPDWWSKAHGRTASGNMGRPSRSPRRSAPRPRRPTPEKLQSAASRCWTASASLRRCFQLSVSPREEDRRTMQCFTGIVAGICKLIWSVKASPGPCRNLAPTASRQSEC